ncbi:MAG: four helix bundle protein [Bacteroidales bacterium]|nr:four helix bundle protein [Bacteroidales bacterium]
MDKYELQKRTMQLALEIIKITKKLPISQESKVITYQIIKSATSTAANYRASCRAKSRKDFIAKLGIVEEECDETIFWLQLMIEAKLLDETIVNKLIQESNSLLAIFVASIKTASKNI